MKLHLWGTDFRRSSGELRQQLFLPPAVRAERLRALCALGFQDLVYLATCNRVEFFTTGKDHFCDTRAVWLSLLAKLGLPESAYYQGYHLEGKAAVRHLMRVAASLESMVVGEPQILGQLKEALRFSKEQGIPVESSLERVFHLAFETAKQVRTQTAIGERPISVANLALLKLQQLETECPVERAVVVGRGPMSVLIVQWLKKNRPRCPITWVNRTLGTLVAMPEAEGVECVGLSQFLEAPGRFSHLFSATSSPHVLFDKRFFSRAGNSLKLVFDLAEPADVDSHEVAPFGARVFALGDFAEEARANAIARTASVAQAEQIIEVALREYCRSRKEAPLLREFSAVEPRVQEALAAVTALIERDYPKEWQDNIQRLVEKAVKKSLHHSREHLREMLRQGADSDSGGSVV